jgi:hypothetical protein
MTPGMKTSEFLGALAVAVGAFIEKFQGVLSTHDAVFASAIVAGLYAVSRGLKKNGQGGN